MTIDDILDKVIAKEGGFVDHPDDRGGATNWGITERVARAAGYQGEMHALPRSEAVRIYRRRYVEAPGFDKIAALSVPIAAELIDTGINMGTGTAGRFLQRALNVLNRQQRDFADLMVDGQSGPATLGALRRFLEVRGTLGEAVMVKALDGQQCTRYIEIAEARPANESFMMGWLQHRVAL